MKLDSVFVREKDTVRQVMQVIDRTRFGIAIVVDNKKLIGVITSGDVRRAILKGYFVGDSVEKIINKKPLVVKVSDLKNDNKVKEVIQSAEKNNVLYIPIVNEDNNIVDLRYYNEIRGYKNGDKAVAKKKDNVLVVGGAGYLGSIICEKLIAKGHKVRVLDIGMFGYDALSTIVLNKNFELVKGDLRDISTITKCLRDVDAVIHLAAIVGDPASSTVPVDTIETNYLATYALAEACKYDQINKFIFASTCSVYGLGEDLLTEESPLRPVSLYARSKISSEEVLMKMADDNFKPTMMRMSTLFGASKRMRFDLVVNMLTAKAEFENKIQIFGGDQWRPFLHVSDAAEAFIKVIEAPIEKTGCQFFNVGGTEQNYSINQVGKLIKEEFPDVEIETLDKDFDKRDYRVSFEKIKKVLNFVPKKSVPDGIKEIKAMIKRGEIKDYKDKIYSNLETVRS